MEISRRKLLALGGTSLGAAGYGGYRYLEDDAATTFEKVRLAVYNGREETLQFYLAFELGDGIDQWRTFELGHREEVETVIEFDGDRTVRAVHGLVDGYERVYEISGGQGTICPKIRFVENKVLKPHFHVRDANCDWTEDE